MSFRHIEEVSIITVKILVNLVLIANQGEAKRHGLLWICKNRAQKTNVSWPLSEQSIYWISSFCKKKGLK